METVGSVESLWRYPVKSMQGEPLMDAFLGYAGVYGDRVFAFHNAKGPVGFPYFTGRENSAMLLCRPRFKDAEGMARPVNLDAAYALSPAINPVYASPDVDIAAPDGQTWNIADPALLRRLARDSDELTLVRSDRAQTDCRPVSLFGIHTAARLGLDKRRFRANVYLDLKSAEGFAEDTLVGKRLRLGDRVEIAVLDRDTRCKMITLDPDTGAADPQIARDLARDHECKAGVYAAVLIEGIVHIGDPVVVVS